MSESTGKRLLVMAFVLAVAMVTWDEVHNNREWPKPARYVGTGTVFGLLGILSPFLTAPLAGLIGTGLTLALIYRTYSKNSGAGESTGAIQQEESHP